MTHAMLMHQARSAAMRAAVYAATVPDTPSELGRVVGHLYRRAHELYDRAEAVRTKVRLATIAAAGRARSEAYRYMNELHEGRASFDDMVRANKALDVADRSYERALEAPR